MMVMTDDTLRLNKLEADVLLGIVSSPTAMADAANQVLAHALATLLAARRFRRKVAAACGLTVEAVDSDGLLIKSVDELQHELQFIYDLASQAFSRNKSLFIHRWVYRWLMKRTFAHYDAMIAMMVTHDAKALGIPDTDQPIDAIMAELNQPNTRQMLEQSIAELDGGHFVSGQLLHG